VEVPSVANFHAIAATSQAIVGLLAEACPRNEFPSAQFALYQASDFKSPMDEGVSVYLYRILVDGSRNIPARPRADGTRRPPPLPLALSYLVTAWAKDPVQQQRLLGFCLRTLDETASLPPGLLNVYSSDPETFAAEETVDVIFDPLSIQDLANIWDPLSPSMQVTASYVARVVAIDSLRVLPTGAPVQTREFALGVPRA
jgi:hypothetical protein